MPCFTPIEAWQTEDGRVRFVERGRILRALKLRCGQCVGCRKDRAAEWAARIVHESRMHPVNTCWFATLTYDDNHVPADNSLRYRDFQLFFKRLRKARSQKIRFYMAGEYGERTARPHYHACLFGVSFPDLAYYRKSPSGHTLFKSAELDRIWQLGLCSLGALTFESAAYTASYINKKITGAASKEKYRRINPDTGEVHFVIPEFARMSLRPGIGRSFFDAYSNEILPRDFVRIDGKKTRVPRYYIELFKALDPFAWDDCQSIREEKAKASLADNTPARLETRRVVAEARAAINFRKL